MIHRTRISLGLAIGCLAVFSVLSSQAAYGDWQEHRIRQGDGHGGWVVRPAMRQMLRHPDSAFTMPFGLTGPSGFLSTDRPMISKRMPRSVASG